MGSDTEEESSPRTKLPLLSIRPVMQYSPERSGAETPPLHTSASIPFHWEEEPGKPKHFFTSLSKPANDLSSKCLELPPRLLLDAKITKLPSPKAVLEGPYVQGRARLKSSSFRMARECVSAAGNWSPEGTEIGFLVHSKRWQKEKGEEMGSWGWKRLNSKGKRYIGEDNYVFPSSAERVNEESREEREDSREKKVVKLTKIKRSGSVPVLPQPKTHFWTTVYQNIKHVVPWKRRKMKKYEKGI